VKQTLSSSVNNLDKTHFIVYNELFSVGVFNGGIIGLDTNLVRIPNTRNSDILLQNIVNTEKVSWVLLLNSVQSYQRSSLM
jgi:hypothetical protein